MPDNKLWLCERCWGEQFEVNRPRCRHCGRTMVLKADPTDEVNVLDQIVDELWNQPGEKSSG